jgi:hypothetical protein
VIFLPQIALIKREKELLRRELALIFKPHNGLILVEKGIPVKISMT